MGLTNADVRVPHEEVPGNILVTVQEVLASRTLSPSEEYQCCLEVNDVIFESLSRS